MSVFKRTNYAEIGEAVPVKQFSQAFQEASSRKKRSLTNGAIKAFRAGHPENIRDALSESQDFDADFATTMLRQITEGREDKSAAIDSAFAKATEAYKEALLTKALVSVVDRSTSAEESFVAALLKSGADVNAYSQGLAPGCLLAWAVFYNQHSPILKLLVDHGASVEAALSRADAKEYSRAKITILRGYQTKTASTKPDAPEADIRELLSQVLQGQKEMLALANKIDRALSLLETPDARQPEETSAPAETLRLRKVNMGLNP